MGVFVKLQKAINNIDKYRKNLYLEIYLLIFNLYQALVQLFEIL